MVMRISHCLLVAGITLLLMMGCNKDEGTGAKIGPVWVTYTTSNSPIFSDNIKTIFVDGENYVWFGTDKGAPYFTKGNWGGIKDSLRYAQAGGGYGYTVNAIAQSKDGSIWFGTQGGGAVRYIKNGTRFVFKRYLQPDVPYATIAGVSGQMTNRGEVFVSTRAAGVGRYTPSTTEIGEGVWTAIDNSNHFTTNNIPTTTVNVIDNSIWFGTADGSVVRYDGDQDWLTSSLPPPYNNYFVLGIAFDLSDHAWIAKSDSGVSVFNNSTKEWIQHYTYGNTGGKMPRGEIKSIATDKNKMRWFGTTQGLVLLNDTTWTTYTISNTPALPSNNITALSYDGYGNLWIGTNKGVAVYNPTGTRFGD
jgi:ligand-binding sensor domain-containing protein